MNINKSVRDAKTFKTFIDRLTKQIFREIKTDANAGRILLQLMIEIGRITYGHGVAGWLAKAKRMSKKKGRDEAWTYIEKETRKNEIVKEIEVIEEAEKIRSEEGSPAYHRYIKWENKRLFGHDPEYAAYTVSLFVLHYARDRIAAKAFGNKKLESELLEKYRRMARNSILMHVIQRPYYDDDRNDYDWNLYDFTRDEYYNDLGELVTPRQKTVKRPVADLDESGNLALLKIAVLMEPDVGFMRTED